MNEKTFNELFSGPAKQAENKTAGRDACFSLERFLDSIPLSLTNRTYELFLLVSGYQADYTSATHTGKRVYAYIMNQTEVELFKVKAIYVLASGEMAVEF